jgi:outer membrane protein OmpA-like peptidoglycan-associated protein
MVSNPSAVRAVVFRGVVASREDGRPNIVSHGDGTLGYAALRDVKAAGKIPSALDISRNFNLTIVEKGEMKQEITAGSILAALDRDGHVALYINFDTGKGDIKADGQAVIDEIASALRNTPALKVGIEGHTDNVGAGFGQTKPIADNAAEGGRAKNRRVELVKK